MVRLQLLGSAELTRGDGTEVRSVLAQPKRLAFLAYLAVATPRGFHRRDPLLALFWPEMDEARARNALGQSLHFLRRALGAEVLPSRGQHEVGVDPRLMNVDVVDFESLVEAGDPAAALGRYRGAFLAGLHVADLPDLERWIEAERGRLAHLAWDTAFSAATAASAAGDLAGALGLARTAVDLQPLNDASVRMLMTLLDRSGDRGGALDAFQRLERELREEYDAEPEPGTVTLAEEIRASAGREAAEPTGSGDPEGPGTTSIVLRSVEVPDADAGRVDLKAPGPPPERPSPFQIGVRRPLRVAVIVAALGVAAYAGSSILRNSSGEALASVDGTPPRLVLADFTDETAEGLGPVVTEALRIDLFRSSVLAPAEAEEVSAALGRLGVDPGQPVTGALAREIAQREGIPAVLDGTVAPVGTGYLLTAALTDAGTGRTLASLRVTARGPDRIVQAIDDLSHRIRREAGESLREIRAEAPLEQVTTSSLEALRLYSESVRAFDELNARPRSAELAEQAVRLDPGFAMAWRQLGRALQGGVDPPRRIEASRMAYEHRERLPEVERYLVEASYHLSRGDGPAARAAYEALLVIAPTNGSALNNLGLLYRYADDLAPAEEVLWRAIAAPGRTTSAYLNLIYTLISLDRGHDASEVLRALEGAYPSYDVPERWRFDVAFVSGDLAAAEAVARGLSDDPRSSSLARAEGLGMLADLAFWFGRLGEAREFNLRAEAVVDDPGPAWRFRLKTARDATLAGDPGWARAHARAGLDAAFGDLAAPQREHRLAALVLASAGDLRGATRVLRDWLELPLLPPDDPGAVGRTALYVLEGAGEDVAHATDTLRRLPTVTRCEDACWAFWKARFHDARGEWVEAAVAFERVRVGGYTTWGPNVEQRLYAMERLGPLYEELGDTAKALEAHERMARQWAGGDTRAQAVVRRHLERVAALRR